MPVTDAKFSTFVDGGDLAVDDIVVGLRNGLNTRFSFQGEPPGTYLPLAGGTMSGDINMANNSITNLPAPVAGGDAANKTYVDSMIGSAAGGVAGNIQYNDAGGFGGDANFNTDGTGNIDITGSLDVDNININGNTISSSNANGDLNLTPNGTGDLVLDGLNWPQADGAANSFLYTDGAGQLGFSTATFPLTAGAAGTILRSNGTNWVASTSTFADTYAVNSLLYAGSANTVTGLAPALSSVLLSSAASTGVPVWSGAMTNGQLIIGSTGATPVVGSLSAGAGISISTGAGTITIAGTGSGIGWNEVVASPQAMVADSGYVANTAGLLTFTLPVTAAFGTAIDLIGKGAGGWIITQNVGQNIQVGSVSSTIGVGGSVASTNRYDSISLICTTADTTWTVLGGAQSAGLTIV